MTKTKTLGRFAMLLTLAATTVGVVTVGAAPPAGADPCGRGCTHDGNATGAGYSAMAALMTATGGDGASTRQPCELRGHEAGLPEDAPAQQGHIEFHSYDNDGDGMYTVFMDCIHDDHTGIPDGETYAWDVLEIYENVAALDPQELVEEALAHMPIGSPTIETSPGGGNPSIVGIQTWLMIDEASWQEDSITTVEGPVSVTVRAWPANDGEVLWDTGEGTRPCVGNGRNPEGSCFWEYQSSSIGQAGQVGGLPAYAITASVTYGGSYSVTVFGEPVGGDDNLGDIQRTSAPYYLAVDEAQALNTGG